MNTIDKLFENNFKNLYFRESVMGFGYGKCIDRMILSDKHQTSGLHLFENEVDKSTEPTKFDRLFERDIVLTDESYNDGII